MVHKARDQVSFIDTKPSVKPSFWIRLIEEIVVRFQEALGHKKWLAYTQVRLLNAKLHKLPTCCPTSFFENLIIGDGSPYGPQGPTGLRPGSFRLPILFGVLIPRVKMSYLPNVRLVLLMRVALNLPFCSSLCVFTSQLFFSSQTFVFS